MEINKNWMNARGIFLPEYRNGVRNFIEFARQKADTASRIKCPCKRCGNIIYHHISLVEEHLLRYGMDKSYTRWIWHGEGDPTEVMSDDDDSDADALPEHGGINSLLDDLRQGVRSNMLAGTNASDIRSDHELNINNLEGISEHVVKLIRDAREPLYPNCVKFSKLEFLIKLLHIKTMNRWSQKSFDQNLALIKAALPDGERLPKSYSEAKGYLRELGLGYISIHACKNDCILFYKENEQVTECPKCGESRYKTDNRKGRKVPQKILRYFPLIPRLQRLYMSKKTAEEMRWHHEQRVSEENILSHPADSVVWKDFDVKYPHFARDPRNIRLGLATDGFNPFGNLSTSYSMWPVMLIPYNVSPWKCMKEPFIFMSLLIPGPKAPGNEIDVYLRPLIDDLKELWENGVQTYDSISRQNFKLRASILWTINDFPAYGNLSGWSTKGYMACPICNKDISSLHLKHGRKICFMGHRRFLPANHSWRTRYNQYFDGKSDRRPPPKELSGADILEQLEAIQNVQFGKISGTHKRKRTEADLNWTKRSIFFELPYWKELRLRHNLDVMHIEKNIFDNVIGTMLNITGKTKDNSKARLDLQEMGIRPELHLVHQGDKFFMPPARYSLFGEEKKNFCTWFKTVKFPDAYASNVARCIGNNDGNISGMKSHDSHVMMQRLLPVVMRGYLHGDVQAALIELGVFFRELCCRKLKINLLEKFEKDIVLILCKLEKIFPPSFFDVMVHLAIHLPKEAILAGPVHYRWMYPIERFLCTLKKYVRNKARPEGSIAEAYVATECVTFCSIYLDDIETRFNRADRNADREWGDDEPMLSIFKQTVRPMGGRRYDFMDMNELSKAHFYILNNCEEIEDYIDEHKNILSTEDNIDVDDQHKRKFAKWFGDNMKSKHFNKEEGATDELYNLACGPDRRVNHYASCIIGGMRFHTREIEMQRRTQNSGIATIGYEGEEEIEYLGVLIDIIELKYGSNNSVFLFQCEWWDISNKKIGIHIDPQFTSINFARTWYQNEPYILATQAKQVIYLKDPKYRGDWHVVQKVIPRGIYDIPTRLDMDENSDVYEHEAFQEEEQTLTELLVDDELITPPLNRADLPSNEVEVDFVFNLHDPDSDDQFINDNEIEDDTLVDYCDSDEDIQIEDDTDMDE